MVDPDNLPITWDFEDGLQGWTHTNGQPYPAGWDVETSGHPSGFYPPDPGDSTMWIDTDLTGPGYWVQDTALSPVLIPAENMTWLKYGYCNADDPDPVYQNELRVGLKYATDGVWNVVELAYYPPNTLSGPAWDSVDVSAYATADLLQIYFYFDELNTWGYYASFDNVSINAVLAQHDAVCYPVYSPSGGIIPPGDYDVTARIRNFGDYTETFNVTANVYDTTDAWNLVHTQMVALTDFPPDGDSIVNFGSVNLGESVYYTEVYTALAGDNNPANDTSSVYTATLMTFDLVYDFETGWQGWTHTNGLSFPEAWDVLESGYKPTWTPPEAGDSCLWIDSDAAGSGVLVQDTALSPVILPDHETEYLKYGIGFNWLGSDTLDIGIKYFDGSAWNAVQLLRHHIDINPTWEIIDVSGYNTYDSVQVYFYYQGTYDWYAAIDNVMMNEGETGIAERPTDKEQFVFGFVPNISNPIKGHTTISYGTTMQSKVLLRIYDASGRVVRTLVNKLEPAGAKTLFWDGRDDIERKVADGVYFLRLEAEDKADTRKMIFVR
ncbi:MAG: T9SS type A sorting domain-containing protein [candidate division WOR-3 bacterium]|nr:MAG: T9SS type A sorting domain-containing protein [candidate division WOR-3 bacterium]